MEATDFETKALALTAASIVIGLLAGFLAPPLNPADVYGTYPSDTSSMSGYLDLFGEIMVHNLGVALQMLVFGSVVPGYSLAHLMLNIYYLTRMAKFIGISTTLLLTLHLTYEIVAIAIMAYCGLYGAAIIWSRPLRRIFGSPPVRGLSPPYLATLTLQGLMLLLVAALLETYFTTTLFEVIHGPYPPAPPFSQIRLGLGFGIPLIAVSIGTLEVWERVFGEARTPPEVIFRDYHQNLFWNIFVAMWEEAIFRGFLLLQLATIWPDKTPIFLILSSFLFAVAHLSYGPAKVPSIMTLGVCFGILALRYGLLASLAAHYALDFVIGLMTLPLLRPKSSTST